MSFSSTRGQMALIAATDGSLPLVKTSSSNAALSSYARVSPCETRCARRDGGASAICLPQAAWRCADQANGASLAMRTRRPVCWRRPASASRWDAAGSISRRGRAIYHGSASPRVVAARAFLRGKSEKIYRTRIASKKNGPFFLGFRNRHADAPAGPNGQTTQRPPNGLLRPPIEPPPAA